jgi:hypothetical protein
MYIPLGFNASSQCTGSGYCFTYANFSASVDNFSYRNLCNPNITISSSIQPFVYNQFIAANNSVIGDIAVNTLLADARWAVSGSCNKVALRSYTITHTDTTGSVGLLLPLYNESTNKIDDIRVTTSPYTFTNRYNPEAMIGAYRTNPTLTDNGPVSGSLRTNTTKDVPNRVFAIEWLRDSGSQVCFLDSGYNPILYNVPRSATTQIDFVANTVPQSFETGSTRTNSWIYGYDELNSTVSSSFYSYRFSYDTGLRTRPNRTFSYVDLNNVTQSIVTSGSVIINPICMKVNSFRIPTLDIPVFPTSDNGESIRLTLNGAC